MSVAQTHAAETDVPLIFLNDAAADPQPQSGSFRLLSAEERLKDAFGVFRADACSGVVHGYFHAVTSAARVGAFAQMQSELATFRHGLYGITDNVQKDLFQFDRVALDDTSRPIPLVDCNSVQFQAACLQLENIVQDFGKGNRHRLLRLAVKA